MTRLTLEIIARTLFGAGLQRKGPDIDRGPGRRRRAFRRAGYSFLLLPESVPTPANLRMRRAVRRLDAHPLRPHQTAARTVATATTCCPSCCTPATKDGDVMTDRQLRDEAMTLFLAGHDTTALTLSWGLVSACPASAGVRRPPGGIGRRAGRPAADARRPAAAAVHGTGGAWKSCGSIRPPT